MSRAAHDHEAVDDGREDEQQRGWRDVSVGRRDVRQVGPRQSAGTDRQQDDAAMDAQQLRSRLTLGSRQCGRGVRHRGCTP
jgi:hypothetical protein